jgi:hypothetical protein
MKGFLTRVANRGRPGREAPAAPDGFRSSSPIAERDQRVGLPGFERLVGVGDGAAARTSPALGSDAGLSGSPPADAPAPERAAHGEAAATLETGGRASFATRKATTVRRSRTDGRADAGDAGRTASHQRRASGPRAASPDAHVSNAGRGANRDAGEWLAAADDRADAPHGPHGSAVDGFFAVAPLSTDGSWSEVAPRGTRRSRRPDQAPATIGEAPTADRAALVQTFEPASRGTARDRAARDRNSETAGLDARRDPVEHLAPPDLEATVIREVHHHHHHERAERDGGERGRPEPATTSPPLRPAPMTAAGVSVIGPLGAGRRSHLRFAMRQR